MTEEVESRHPIVSLLKKDGRSQVWLSEQPGCPKYSSLQNVLSGVRELRAREAVAIGEALGLDTGQVRELLAAPVAAGVER